MLCIKAHAHWGNKNVEQIFFYFKLKFSESNFFCWKAWIYEECFELMYAEIMRYLGGIRRGI